MKDYSTNNKRIAKNTLVLYLRSIFLMAINLYTSRLVLQALGVDDFGIYTIVGGFVGLFSIISGTLSSATQRFITYSLGENNPCNLKKVFSTSLTLHIIIGVIVVILLELIGEWALYSQLNIPFERIGIANIVLQCSILTLFFGIIAIPYHALIIAHERMSAFAYISILDGGLKLLIALYLLNCAFDKLMFFAISQLCVSVLLRLVYSIYSRCNFDEARKTRFYIDKQLFTQMFAFAGWNMIGQGSMILRNQGVDILLNIFFGVTINAAKGISNQVQQAVNQFVGNFSTSIIPQLTMAIAQKDYARSHKLMFHGSRLYFFMMMIFTIPLMISAREVLSIWLVEVPVFAAAMVTLSLLYIQSNALSKLLIHSILANGNIRTFQLLSGGIKLMALPLSYFSLKFGGNPLSVIWVNILLVFCSRCVELYFTNMYLFYDIKKNIVKVELLCWLTFSVAFILSTLSYKFITDFLISSLFISFGISVISIWLIGVDEHEKDFIKNHVKKEIINKFASARNI